MYTAEFTN